ncbi:MAG: oxidoreductase [Bacteroidetes bacterium GWF2_42_66]|nr:MAG: oxidoreductase [Bacteroidetes bacterium GWA2_42_15]OFY00211.1 MAG: oxidoreductase [Bacteroidetes bacterium GWE2_42_39]OFY40352.1 MAG: oxidoreductase [Bacteroidetes bacterium GWF2_42_66]HBL73761.1 oxidoreductase [Prolixibacteraceae bacterium]HCR88935.1 oxidoreductase [Prolixibacteraceae bacterium]
MNPVYEKIIEDIADRDYTVIENLFDDAILRGLKNRLLQNIKSEKMKAAGIGNRNHHLQDHAIRSDKIHWIDRYSENQSEQQFVSKIDNLSAYLNKTCFTGITDFEFHYACFEKGTFYKRHIDRFKNDNSRKFSVITYLNERWKKEHGGELVLYMENEEIIIPPEWGKTIIFRSHLIEHEVLPSHTRRLSITGWLK